MLKKVYLEITNICNLACSFCPGTSRSPRFMPPEEFRLIAGRLRPHTDYLYFHLMGEPLLHPDLPELLDIAHSLGFRVIITTNGTMLDSCGDILLASPATHRVNISLQSHEANLNSVSLEEYMDSCCLFAKRASENGVYVCFRLWNENGNCSENGSIVSLLEKSFPVPWGESRRSLVLGKGIFLEHGQRFDWPVQASASEPPRFCYGLRDQIGVLCDGTVVPCCLDSDGNIPLGNILCQELDEILASPRARAIYDGFSRGQAVEGLCRGCGYANRF